MVADARLDIFNEILLHVSPFGAAYKTALFFRQRSALKGCDGPRLAQRSFFEETLCEIIKKFVLSALEIS
jgi:hypothetical protein